MTAHTTDNSAQNALLGCLSEALRNRLLTAAEIVTLRVRDPIYDVGQLVEHAYFPLGGGISHVFTMNDGDQVEVGMIGREGVTGFPAVLTHGKATGMLYTQIPGSAWKVPRDVVVAALHDFPEFLRPFLRYVDAQLSQLYQYSACNRLHNLDERFARWLAMAHDRVVDDDVPLTHDFLALMLGVRRAGVNNAALTLQKTGVITYKRGNILVLDRAGLQHSACECYDAVEDRFQEQMGYSIRKYRIEDTVSGSS